MGRDNGQGHGRFGLATFAAFLAYTIVTEISHGFWGALAAGISGVFVLKMVEAFLRGPRPEPSS